MDWHLKLRRRESEKWETKKMIVNIVSFFLWIFVDGTRWINNNNKWDKIVVKYELLPSAQSSICTLRTMQVGSFGAVHREFEHRNQLRFLFAFAAAIYLFISFKNLRTSMCSNWFIQLSTTHFTGYRLHPNEATVQRIERKYVIEVD